ncbi:hypothetical protein [Fluviicola taffensis]|uniref:Lipocalin-like domain-containing protein n=1 Tax=Fluviicola taffensis (strain DSM 16823 / NCIMB 13979 / RW262) TaxID=755732 RepID=F2IHM4_FLUTR|nr:hypothetical protein [Fluviicola taffensis]AEA44802.1 hypothetical protein Fluta_2822 [Fluviicola taffensis DSM 16823]
MNHFTYPFLITLLSIFTTSCHRKAVHKTHPEFIGRWYHEETNGESWYIDMDEKSRGVIWVYGSDGNFSKDHNYGENPHKWRYNTKRQELTHGIISERFKVNQLPTVAETTIISGYDTIPIGKTYCIIKDDYYRKTE